jgi:hypothetical protein
MPPTTAGVDNLYYQDHTGRFWDCSVPDTVFHQAFAEQALMSTAQEEFSYYGNEYPFDMDFAYMPLQFPEAMDTMSDMAIVQPMVGIPAGHEMPQPAPYIEQPIQEEVSVERDERCSVDRELDDDIATQSETDTVEGCDPEANEKDAHMYFSLNRAVGNSDSAIEIPPEERGPQNGTPRINKRGSEGMPLKMLLNDVLDYIGPNSSKYASERKDRVEASIKANAGEEKTVTNAENITKQA